MTSDIETKRKWAKKRRELVVVRGDPDREDDRIVFSASCLLGAIVAAAILILMAFIAGKACAEEIPEDVAVRVLIGEAGNQGEVGMIAVAEVLRRRGSTRGFYGLKAAHVDRQPAWVWDLARKAWRRSAETNYTQGATHFENVRAFGEPYWAQKMDVVFSHRDHTFYRERKG